MESVFVFILIPLISLWVSDLLTRRLFKKYPKMFGRNYPMVEPYQTGLRMLVAFGVWCSICSGVFFFVAWIV